MVYFNGARALADGRGFTDPFGSAIVLFPPGYPAVLALGHQLGMGVLDAGRWLGALSFGVTVFFAAVLLRRHVRSGRRSERGRRCSSVSQQCSSTCTPSS